MMKTFLTLIASLIIGVLASISSLIVSIPELLSGKQNQTSSTAIIGEHVINVEIADTSQKQMKGLGDRESLEESSGMLFVFNNSKIRTFWMKGMRFPIDIVWIREDKTVSGCSENVPSPSDPNQLIGLETRSSSEPVKYVLELNAGKCQEWGIKQGTLVQFNID